jgi:hypothetical protein
MMNGLGTFPGLITVAATKMASAVRSARLFLRYLEIENSARKGR